MKYYLLLWLLLQYHVKSFSLSNKQPSAVTVPRDIADTAVAESTANFTSEVLGWLNSEGVAWQDANHQIPLSYQSHTKTSTFVLLEKSKILFHICPTPTCLEESLPPSLNRKLTEWSLLVPETIRKIIHLHEDIWMAKHDIVKSRLQVQAMAHTPKRIFARKTVCQKIEATAARTFLAQNHLWGATKARYQYGLFQNVTVLGKRRIPNQQLELVAVATFSKCRKVMRNDTLYHSYELIRYCSLRDVTVVGGISKLLKQFVRDRNKQHDNNTTHPVDIVTMVDRDWGAATGWETMGFHSMSILDPLVMAVSSDDGRRRYLVGAGLDHGEEELDAETLRRQEQSGLRPRLGLEMDILQELNATADQQQAMERLASDNLYPVHDAGVERLYMLVDAPKEDAETAEMLWDTASPKYTTRYYSSNNGIVLLLEYAATGSPPLDAHVHEEALASWKSTFAKDAKLIFSAPSLMDPDATIEVCERENGWRTMRFVNNQAKISSIYHGMYKIDPTTNEVEPVVVIQEHLRTMGVLALMAGLDTTTNNADAQSDSNQLRFLHFGYGAGTLVRFLAYHAEQSQHVVVELDHAVVDAMKHTMPETQHVSVLTDDALHFVQTFGLQQQQPFDCICIDVFDENNFVPESLYSVLTLQQMSDKLLTSRGILVWNFHSGGKRRTRVINDATESIGKVFCENFTWVPSIDSTHTGGNSILYASNIPLPRDENGCTALSRMAMAVQNDLSLTFDAATRVSTTETGIK